MLAAALALLSIPALALNDEPLSPSEQYDRAQELEKLCIASGRPFNLCWLKTASTDKEARAAAKWAVAVCKNTTEQTRDCEEVKNIIKERWDF
jgi:hypothetical protein